MTPDEGAEVLREARTIQIASNGQDGFPHLVAMWFGVVDGKVYFSTYETSQKVVNLQRDPRVSAMVELGHDYAELRGVVIRGKARIISAGDPDRAEMEQVLVQGMAGRYGGGGGGGGLSPKRVIVEITPERIYSWDHRKLAAGVH
jgi:PPOX class probable F420-dependent enzyme